MITPGFHLYLSKATTTTKVLWRLCVLCHTHTIFNQAFSLWGGWKSPSQPYSLPEAGYCGMLHKIKVSKSATEEEILDECKKQASHTSAIQLDLVNINVYRSVTIVANLSTAQRLKLSFKPRLLPILLRSLLTFHLLAVRSRLEKLQITILGLLRSAWWELRMQTVWLSCHGRADGGIIQSVLSPCDISWKYNKKMYIAYSHHLPALSSEKKTRFMCYRYGDEWEGSDIVWFCHPNTRGHMFGHHNSTSILMWKSKYSPRKST